MDFVTKLMTQGLQTIVTNILNELVKAAMSILNTVIVTPFNFNAIPGYHQMSEWVIGTSFAWLAVLLGKEFLMNMFEGPGEVNPLLIIKNAIVSGVLISASPLIVSGIILPAVNEIMSAVQKIFGRGSVITADMSNHLTLVAGTGFSDAALVAILPEGGFWVAVLFAASFLVVYVWIAFSCGMRWIELVFLALVGPFLAISKASCSNSWDLWLRETISVAASQVVQVFCVLIGVDLFLNPLSDVHAGANALMYLFISIGAFIFALRGPKTLRTILGAPPNGMKAVQALASNATKAAAL